MGCLEFWRMIMPIQLKRAYEEAGPHDGYRVLVDRLWPRGVAKERAAIDEWMRDVAPSDELRKWFHAQPSQWATFRRHYLSELKDHREELRRLVERSQHEFVTLVYGSSDPEHNNAVVLKQYLGMLDVR